MQWQINGVDDNAFYDIHKINNIKQEITKDLEKYSFFSEVKLISWLYIN